MQARFVIPRCGSSDRGPGRTCATDASSKRVDAAPASAYLSLDEPGLAVVLDSLAEVLHSLQAVLAQAAVELRVKAELAGAVPVISRKAICAAGESRA